MPKIHVMHVLTDTNIGGAGTLLYNTIACGDTERFDFTVVLPQGSRLLSRFAELPCRTLTVPAGHDRSMRVRDIPVYLDLVRDERPDIFHAHSALAARVAARLGRVPVCLQTRHCVFPLAAYQKNPLFRLCFRWASNALSDRVVAVADAAKENLIELGMDERRIDVIINGVRPLRECSEEEVATVMGRHGLTEQHFIVGMVARLEEYKGQKTLLQAAGRCLQVHPDFRFLLIGDGGAAEEYRLLARSLGVEEQVVFVGFVEDVAPYYAMMDVNVNASFGTETSSLALSEGMSVGVPAVASDYGGNPNMIIDGENGLLFPVKDEQRLAELLVRLYEDRALLARLSEGARRHYRERFTAKGMVRQLESLYLELLRQKGRLG